MNEQTSTTTPTGRSNTSQRLTGGLLFTVIFPIVCLIVGFVTPSPYKEWGLAGVLISIATLVLFRTVEQFLSADRAKASLPYSIATFLVLVPCGVWGTGTLQQVAFITFFTIVGVATFYSLVWITVDEFKKIVLHRSSQ